MRIENNYQQQTFGRAYLDMQSLNRYRYGKKTIIKALKERETPLRKYLKTVVNTKDFEKDMGDCFISFNRQRFFGEYGIFHTISFEFPKKREQAIKHELDFFENGNWGKLKKEKFEPFKEMIISDIANKTTCYAGFNDIEELEQDGAEELAKYITGKEIVKDLKEHIAKFRTKYLKESC
jgi:hypothetical protein